MGVYGSVDEAEREPKKNALCGGIEGTPGVRKRQLTVLGGPVRVYEAGERDRPAVVLLHGAMYDESRFIWDSMFPALSERFHVFALDTPRHGGSRPWEGELDRTRLMEILEDAFAQLGLRFFCIVGLSMGGGLAIAYAAKHPEQIGAMALFEPGGLGDRVDWQLLTWLYLKTPGMLRLLSRQYAKYDLAKVQKLMNSIFTKGTRPSNSDRLSRILRDEIHGKYTCGERDLDDWQIGAIRPFSLSWNLLREAGEISCPTLWLRGAESRLVKQHEMERAVRLARSQGATAELIVIPNAGHILPLEQPERANAEVLSFLTETTRKSAPNRSAESEKR
ncbi:MAG: alpha/beta hydrolase [Christensenella sp.]|nr:alpha/beta hydrolase [Christensenella sp.]